MKKNTSSKKDKNVAKAARMAAEAVALTKANKLGARKTASKRAIRKVMPSRGVVAGSTRTLQAPGAKSKFLHQSALEWAKGLENPFTGDPQKCPFNFNPVPSYLSFVATTVAARIGADFVAANTATQLTFFPGHMSLNEQGAVDLTIANSSVIYDMDEVAYHHPYAQIGNSGGIYNVGPCNFTDAVGTGRVAIAYVKTAGLGVGGASNLLNTALDLAVGWNATIPISGDSRLDGHLRYKLLSMGIKVINTTPELNRGGSVVTVQPVTVCDVFSAQAANAIHPSWKDWGPEGCTLSWIPRLRDLAYWHPTAGAVLTATVPTGPQTSAYATGAGVLIWINNPTSAVQSYDVEVVCHWEFSGYSVQTLSDQGKATHLSDGVVKGALSAQTNNAPTASGFASTLESAAGGIVQAGVQLGKDAVAGVGSAMRMAPRVAARAALQ